jgi:hypothetical protein
MIEGIRVDALTSVSARNVREAAFGEAWDQFLSIATRIALKKAFGLSGFRAQAKPQRSKTAIRDSGSGLACCLTASRP